MNTRHLLLCSMLVIAVTTAPSASAGITAYMKIPDIPGESQDRDHRDWIDILTFDYSVEAAESGEVGSGRTRGRAEVAPVQFEKLADVASVYLNLATLQGRSFDRVEVEIYEDKTLSFRYEFRDVRFVSYRSGFSEGDDAKRDRFALVFESVRVIHYRPGNGNSAGDEHEIEYDIAAGV